MNTTQQKYWVIIPAAGIGQRFGGSIPKQYQTILGKPVIEHTLIKFLYHPQIEKIVVVISKQDLFWQQLRLDFYHEKVMVVTGGMHRSQSVYAGLEAIQHFAQPNDFVLVHDVVRPCITHADLNSLISSVANHPVGGILATKVRDTLKYVNNQNEIVNTLSRENVWHALTPQMFRYQILIQAMQQAIKDDITVTDEAGAIEALGFIPMIVEGRNDNIKITYHEDLALAEKYI